MLHQLLNPTALLSSYGAIGLFVVLFAETGLLIGFFLPGDSLLFAAGLACATTPGATLHMSLPAVMAAAAAGALIGAQTGYLIGRSAGPALLRRSRSRKLHRGAERAAAMLTRYGPGKAVTLARFIPVVRTVANPVAGALGVPSVVFTLWQVVGGLLWSLGIIAAGYGLGSAIPGIDQYLLPAIAVIVIVSLLPLALEALRVRRERTEAAERAERGEPAGPDAASSWQPPSGQPTRWFWQYRENEDSPSPEAPSGEAPSREEPSGEAPSREAPPTGRKG
jgi:membrane-associated protein